jgi:Transposase IS116/IS110/IS902 family
MAFTGLEPLEYSSGTKEVRGRITKTGNAHLRRVLSNPRGSPAIIPLWAMRFGTDSGAPSGRHRPRLGGPVACIAVIGGSPLAANPDD